MKTIDELINAELPALSKHRKFSEDGLRDLRARASKADFGLDILVGTYGSYARREASLQSDLDFFAVCKTSDQIADTNSKLDSVANDLLTIAGKPPSPTGSFGHAHDLPEILSNIGGSKDSNEAITRRVLFLLEGEYLHGHALAVDLRQNLIGQYVRPTISSHQLALFLLNDIIRYYRTICVDFEFKTMQATAKKPWGTRNVKLVFSRKLLYFSGIIAIAETAQRTYGEKIKTLENLFALPVVDRIITVCGDRSLRALKIYEEFLEEMSRSQLRDELDQVTEETRNDSESFRILKDRGHHFSWELLSLLKSTYENSHPIHKALIL